MMDPIVKLQRLKRALTGDAELLIKNLELNDANYTVARNLLINRYQHTRQLVNSYLKKVYELPIVKTESAKSLRSILNELNNCTTALKLLKLNIEDYQLVYQICRKLPQSFLTEWEKSQGMSVEIPTYSAFILFLESRFRMMEMIEPSEHANKNFHVNKIQDSKQHKRFSNANSKRSSLNCMLCHGPHKLDKCDNFSKMQQSSRFETVKANRACINCLDISHTTRSCRSKQRCPVCHKSHHLLLHRYEVPPTLSAPNQLQNAVPNNHPQNAASTSNNQPSSRSFYVNSKETTTLLGTAQVRATTPFGMSIVIRALIDPCSEDNYIISSTVQSLHLKKYFSPSTIGVLGDNQSSECTHRIYLNFSSLDDKFRMKISAGVVENITSNLPSTRLPMETFGYLNTLPLADCEFNEPGEIQLLLGVNVHTRITLSDHKRFGESLIAEKTMLGYLVRGQAGTEITPRFSQVFVTKNSNADLNCQIKKFWEVEEVDYPKQLHPDDALCEDIFKSSIHQNPEGFLSMDLPFKENKNPEIGPSRFMAIKRLFSLEKKLNANAYLKNEYHMTIRNYLDAKHLTKTVGFSGHGYYLPHHAVIKESSTTTKVRVVFDASSRSADGSSLNDHLLTGPKLQRDIREILFNWRQYPFAITGDIEKMYRMFLINPDHHVYQKIVWRFSESEPIQDYMLTTATFGTSCAPFLALRCLQYIAEMHATTNPIASTAINNDFYVDDFISGGFTIEEALQKQTQVRRVLQSYQLTLRKWSSNNKNTLANVPTELLEISKDLTFDETEFRKTLGVFWSQSQDSFFFSITLPIDSNGMFTKRQILSLIARLYDPLGWVSPCTMLAKQLMQKVWQSKAGWDDMVEDSICKRFTEFLNQLPLLKNFKVPRWTNITDAETPLTILGFSDASDRGYSAVVYLVDPQSTIQDPSLLLLTSKTKLADLKYQSTARLELNGALLLSDLLKWTVQLYKPRSVNVQAYCDSKIVLAWLQGHPSKWKTYISNRTSQILEWMDPKQWNYIDTKINPADCASRGLLPQELLEHDLWIRGPKVSDLHNQQSISLDNEQQRLFVESVKKNSLVLHLKKIESFDLLAKFSNHRKLLRIIGNITNYLSKILSPILNKTVVNNAIIERVQRLFINWESPENLVFRRLQYEFYKDEISKLESNAELKSESKIKGLHPFIDSYGILRVGGRLQNADLSFDQRHPIILPSKHQVVTNLIAEAHDETFHGTELLTQSYLRNRFHIPRISEKVRNFIHRCMTCFKYAKRQQEILMGSLPADRVNLARPFQHSGVDYAGPITTKAYRGRCKKFTKSYIAVFVCLCTKAIHIELVSDLSSEAFLAAFRRFCGRRGLCQRLYSDNGTNFVGANKILQNEIRLAELTWKSELETDFKQRGTEWHFIPPATPHFGGLWEASVKSIKNHLKKTIGSSLLTFEEISTVLVQIEAVLNSRPLCPLSDSPNEYNFLTPGHFLIGGPLVAPPEKQFDLDKTLPHQRWQHVQATYQRFALLWKRDYLQNLQNRPKGLTTTTHYKVGDLVLLTDDDTYPTLWPTVIIDQVHPGNDDIVREDLQETSY